MALSTEVVPDQAKTEAVEAHVIWMTTGLSCDGDSVAMTSAVNPSLEDIITQAIPGMPKVIVHNPVLAYENGDEFIEWWWRAERGELDPFVLCVEGSIPNEKLSGEGHWAAIGDDPETGQPITTSEWLDRLAPKAAAVVAIGTCATYGGIPAMKNNPTGAMGVADHLGWNWKSAAGLPVVNIPGCPAQPDNMTEVLLYLALHLAGRAPVPDLDEQLRPRWLFGRTVREGCNRAGFAEQGQFATEYGDDPRCLVKLGCKGPVVKCNVPVRGWVDGYGGCPNVGGICMACTMPGFPDKFMPFMDEDPAGAHGGATSSSSPSGRCSSYFRHRNIKNKYDVEPEWRKPGSTARDRLPAAQLLVDRTGEEHRNGDSGDTARRLRRSWSRRCRGIRSPGSSAASASTPRSTSPTGRCSSATATSMIFRGFDIFMKGIDPRDAHFITSRICGICGDNHCTCSCLNQNMAYGVKPPPLGDLAFNLAETADYMFDHAIFNDCMCERRLLRADGQGDEPVAAGEGRAGAGAELRHPRLPDDRRHHAVAEPVHRRVLPRDPAGGALHARDVLPVRRPAHAPVDDHAGRLSAPTSPTRR